MRLVRKMIIGLINKKTSADGRKVMRRLQRITSSPMEEQKRFLQTLLLDNKDTEFGKKYDFASIRSMEEYRERVPVSTYDDYSQAIHRMAKGETGILTAYPVNHYSKSSGTMGNPKRIPFSDRSARLTDDYAKSYTYALLDKNGLLSTNPSLTLIESVLSTLPSGATCGSYSAKSSMNNKFFIENLFTPPFEVMMPKGNMNSRHLHAFYALKEKNLSSALCAFYSYFLEVLRYIEKNWELLADDIEKGTIDDSIQMPQELRSHLLSKLRPDPKRAAEIRLIFRQSSTLPLVPRIWPRFKYLVGIGTAGFSTYTEKLKAYFGPDIHFVMYGVIASEAIFSVPIRLDSGESVLLPDSVFYEFLPEGESDYSRLLTMDQLEVGRNYEIVMTNTSGLYRYKMRDVVHVVGMYNNTPTIEFLFRADQTVNLVGEKTTEYALRQVVKQTVAKCGFEMIDYCMYPNPDAEPVRYEFLIEPVHLPDNFDYESVRDELDKALSIANPSMGDKLEKGIVGKSQLYFLQEETTLLYRDMMIMKGVSSAQLKPVRVIDNLLKKNFFYVLIDERFKRPD